MAKANYGNLPINHSDEPIRLFKSDALEFFTHIHPGCRARSSTSRWSSFAFGAESRGGSPARRGRRCGAASWPGSFVWTLSEYLLHRFLFHFEPTSPRLKWVWYLIHGVHHEQPQCKTRLVMPPVLSIPMALAFYLFFHVVVGSLIGAPRWTAPLFAGFVTGYIAYDMTHYATHHLPMSRGFLKFLKRYHLLHHYKTPDDRFGISSPLWDLVFGTRPPKGQ